MGLAARAVSRLAPLPRLLGWAGHINEAGLAGGLVVHVIAGTAQSAGQLYNSSRDGSALIVTAGLLDNEMQDDNLLLGPRPGFDQKDVNPAHAPALCRRIQQPRP